MLKIAEQIRSKGMQTRMLVQIHDELLFEAPPDELEAAEALVREAMEHPYPLEVPLVVGMGHGASWAEAH
jgi:DNA polymerase-1